MTSFVRNILQNPLSKHEQFQAENAPTNCNISQTINPVKSKFEVKLRPSVTLRSGSQIQHGWRPTFWKSLCHKWSKIWQADAVCQTRSRKQNSNMAAVFSETGSSIIFDEDWNISSKRGLQI